MTDYADDLGVSSNGATEESYQTFSAAGESVSEAVVRAVATTTDCDPLELDQLYGVVDPDALDDLFTESTTGSPPTEGQFIFSFSGCEVIVSPETVAVRPLRTGADNVGD
ncbi:HalOD1 output domain-containing protein [Haloprofundus halobius]|uniref:HalOD1 output domain-containing protein n=1 Tax=Haloprofundus halobius TaxID=2876194 RepID=UPI001CCFE329|nr:HalOD1 output domain-containing protein [Haloprofundus halobius]